MLGGMVKGAVSSLTEGGGALVQSVKDAVEGDWGSAAENFTRAGLEGAGAAGQAFLGPGAEVAQEAVEGALDKAVLERKEVPGPGGVKNEDWSFDNMLKGAVSGGAQSAMGVFGGMSGGGQDTLGKLLGAASGNKGGGVESVFVSSAGQSGGKGLFAKLGDVGQGSSKVNGMQDSSRRANARVRSSGV